MSFNRMKTPFGITLKRYRYLSMHKLPWYWFYPIHPPTPLSSSVEVPAIQNFKLECPVGEVEKC